jgi:hypothetical protein
VFNSPWERGVAIASDYTGRGTPPASATEEPPEMGSLLGMGRAGETAKRAGQGIAKAVDYYAGMPKRVYEGVQPEVRGQWSEGDDRRAEQLANAAYEWAPQTAFGTVFDPFGVKRSVGAGGVTLGSGAGGGSKIVQREVPPTKGEQIGAIAQPSEPVLTNRPLRSEEFYGDASQRDYKPGVYKDPRVIAAEAAARTAAEHPALKSLFGVTRDDLWEIGKRGTRQGNVDPETVIWRPAKERGSYAADAIMNPRNAQRQIDALVEAEKYPQLTHGMDAWYVMDPLFEQMVKLVGKEQAIKDYPRFNATVTPFSSNSDVLTELNRGTAANMMARQGRFSEFAEFAGMPVESRGSNFPDILRDVKPHLRHGQHIPPVQRYLETGAHGYGQDTVKNPLYSLASGVPETGFQTRLPVPDAHLARASGISDVRKNASPGDYMGGSEYRSFGPWYRENVARPVGIEAVSAQGRQWGLYGPQTGVKTTVGAPKLELLSQLIWERAHRLGIDPAKLRDDVLTGKGHATWLLPAIAAGGFAKHKMGALADQSEYQ